MDIGKVPGHLKQSGKWKYEVFLGLDGFYLRMAA